MVVADNTRRHPSLTLQTPDGVFGTHTWSRCAILPESCFQRATLSVRTHATSTRIGPESAKALFLPPALHLTDGALNFGGPLHPVDIQGDTVSTKLPTQRPLTCYFSVTDERGLKVSTPHVELEK